MYICLRVDVSIADQLCKMHRTCLYMIIVYKGIEYPLMITDPHTSTLL